jgi:3-deoxy-manno-octulosonate cytidylyltransferase (CMP-KDO synthetase)
VACAAAAADLADPNCVKVVLDRRGFALYFSRSAIPWCGADRAGHAPLRHIGLYAYRREFLLEFVSLERGPAEQAEALEQLRVLEHGRRIRVAIVEGWDGLSVDVPADIARVEARLAARARG